MEGGCTDVPFATRRRHVGRHRGPCLRAGGGAVPARAVRIGQAPGSRGCRPVARRQRNAAGAVHRRPELDAPRAPGRGARRVQTARHRQRGGCVDLHRAIRRGAMEGNTEAALQAVQRAVELAPDFRGAIPVGPGAQPAERLQRRVHRVRAGDGNRRGETCTRTITRASRTARRVAWIGRPVTSARSSRWRRMLPSGPRCRRCCGQCDSERLRTPARTRSAAGHVCSCCCSRSARRNRAG